MTQPQTWASGTKRVVRRANKDGGCDISGWRARGASVMVPGASWPAILPNEVDVVSLGSKVGEGKTAGIPTWTGNEKEASRAMTTWFIS